MVPRFRVLVTGGGGMEMTEKERGLKFKIKSSVLDLFRMRCLFAE